MTLKQDKKARSYIVDSLRKKFPAFTKPLVLICFPISVVASWFLFNHDTERPNSWIFALVLTPAMLLYLRSLPALCSIKRWTIGDSHIILSGMKSGRIEGRDLINWQIVSEERLPGYYNLSIATKRMRSAILLSEQTYSREQVQSLMQERFGDQK